MLHAWFGDGLKRVQLKFVVHYLL